MLYPGLQHCQIKLPWVTTVNVYLLNDPLSACENISLVFCATWKRAGQRWLQKTFSRVLGTVLSSGAHVYPFVPSLSWGGLRLLEFGLEHVKLWITSALQKVNLWLALTALETPVPLAGEHLKPGCGSHAIMDVRTLPGALISAWACCQMGIPPLNTVTAC